MQNNTSRNATMNKMLACGVGILAACGGANAGPVALETGGLNGELRYNQVTGELIGSGTMVADLGAMDAPGFDLGADALGWVLNGAGGPEGDFTMDVSGIGDDLVYELEFDGSYSIPGEYRTSFGLFGTSLVFALFEVLSPSITQLDIRFDGFALAGFDDDWAVFSASEIQLSSFSMFGTPTPGTTALLAVGGVAACRRRRRADA